MLFNAVGYKFRLHFGLQGQRGILYFYKTMTSIKAWCNVDNDSLFMLYTNKDMPHPGVLKRAFHGDNMGDQVFR